MLSSSSSHEATALPRAADGTTARTQVRTPHSTIRTSVSSRASSKSGATAPCQAGPVPPQPLPLPPPQQPPRSLQRPSPQTYISDVRDNTDTRKMGATTSSYTDAGREVTADGLELT
ncbi:hypothetical protein THAOC_31312 [Thalassiosira oceanica]|uniref:Uncharacterized protein n=1 Tax=Thalassiosira oceanica TaxID=159749 RepID=K0RBY8_THAOC|nr:hypothetical protein THAOC_31312 [Thalassiosira oceanica]|eukprot:EJK49779.1 hypothetical protein THAOC_31312 [Thalassiosira oceanica]